MTEINKKQIYEAIEKLFISNTMGKLHLDINNLDEFMYAVKIQLGADYGYSFKQIEPFLESWKNETKDSKFWTNETFSWDDIPGFNKPDISNINTVSNMNIPDDASSLFDDAVEQVDYTQQFKNLSEDGKYIYTDRFIRVNPTMDYQVAFLNKELAEQLEKNLDILFNVAANAKIDPTEMSNLFTFAAQMLTTHDILPAISSELFYEEIIKNSDALALDKFGNVIYKETGKRLTPNEIRELVNLSSYSNYSIKELMELNGKFKKDILNVGDDLINNILQNTWVVFDQNYPLFGVKEFLTGEPGNPYGLNRANYLAEHYAFPISNKDFKAYEPASYNEDFIKKQLNNIDDYEAWINTQKKLIDEMGGNFGYDYSKNKIHKYRYFGPAAFNGVSRVGPEFSYTDVELPDSLPEMMASEADMTKGAMMEIPEVPDTIPQDVIEDVTDKEIMKDQAAEGWWQGENFDGTPEEKEAFAREMEAIEKRNRELNDPEFLKKEVEGIASAKNLSNYTDQELYDEFVRINKIVKSAEKWSELTPELEYILQTQDWESFSRARGYTQEEIKDFARWLEVAKEMDKRFPGKGEYASLGETLNYAINMDEDLISIDDWKSYMSDKPTNAVDERLRLEKIIKNDISNPRLKEGLLKRYLDYDEISKDLPSNIKNELLVYTNKEIINDIDIFKNELNITDLTLGQKESIETIFFDYVEPTPIEDAFLAEMEGWDIDAQGNPINPNKKPEDMSKFQKELINEYNYIVENGQTSAKLSRSYLIDLLMNRPDGQSVEEFIKANNFTQEEIDIIKYETRLDTPTNVVDNVVDIREMQLKKLMQEVEDATPDVIKITPAQAEMIDNALADAAAKMNRSTFEVIEGGLGRKITAQEIVQIAGKKLGKLFVDGLTLIDIYELGLLAYAFGEPIVELVTKFIYPDFNPNDATYGQQVLENFEVITKISPTDRLLMKAGDKFEDISGYRPGEIAKEVTSLDTSPVRPVLFSPDTNREIPLESYVPKDIYSKTKERFQSDTLEDKTSYGEYKQFLSALNGMIGG